MWRRTFAVSIAIAVCLCLTSLAQASVAGGHTIVGARFVNAATPPPGAYTGIYVAPGSTVTVAGSGIAYYGPDYCTPTDDSHSTDPDGNRPGCGKKFDRAATLPSAPIGELLAKTACDKTYTPVGTGGTFQSIEGGELYLLYNDSFYADNSGGYQAKITVLPPPPNYTAPAVCHHYDVAMQAWIPERKVVDPLYPVALPFLSSVPSPIEALLAAAGDPPGCLSGPALTPSDDYVVRSVYKGDGHSDYGTGTYREAREVTFDSDGSKIYNLALNQSLASPVTVRTHTIRDRTTGKVSSCTDMVTDPEEAPPPTSSGNGFAMQYDRKDGLAALADPLAAELSAALAVLLHININVSTPPVAGTISGTVSPSGDLALNFTHPTFPSLGLRVKIDGSVVLGGLVNDVSCLGPRQVLGVGGVVRLVTGLNTSTTTRLVAVPKGNRTVSIPSPLCWTQGLP